MLAMCACKYCISEHKDQASMLNDDAIECTEIGLHLSSLSRSVHLHVVSLSITLFRCGIYI